MLSELCGAYLVLDREAGGRRTLSVEKSRAGLGAAERVEFAVGPNGTHLVGDATPKAEIPLALLLFNVGVELGQVAFVLLVILLERSFRVLEVRWPGLVERCPGYAVGTLGAYWTIQRTLILLGGSR